MNSREVSCARIRLKFTTEGLSVRVETMALAGAGGPYQNYAESKTLIPGFVPQKLSEIDVTPTLYFRYH